MVIESVINENNVEIDSTFSQVGGYYSYEFLWLELVAVL